jgi:hypothetical protein
MCTCLMTKKGVTRRFGDPVTDNRSARKLKRSSRGERESAGAR